MQTIELTQHSKHKKRLSFGSAFSSWQRTSFDVYSVRTVSQPSLLGTIYKF